MIQITKRTYLENNTTMCPERPATPWPPNMRNTSKRSLTHHLDIPPGTYPMTLTSSSLFFIGTKFHGRIASKLIYSRRPVDIAFKDFHAKITITHVTCYLLIYIFVLLQGRVRFEAGLYGKIGAGGSAKIGALTGSE